MDVLTDAERIQKAETASSMAILSVILCLMTSCGACVTVFLALPISMWGLYLCRTALDTEDPSELVRAYARPAMFINLVCLLYSGALCLLILAYVLLYGGMIGAVFLAAIVGA